MSKVYPLATSRPRPQRTEDLMTQELFLTRIFGDQLTIGKQPNGRPVPLSWCLLRLMDATKTNCLWQEAYRRLESLMAGTRRISARSAEGHAFFCPNGFRGNGRQTARRPAPDEAGRMRFRDPAWRFSEEKLFSLLAVSLDFDLKLAAPEILAMHDESPATFWHQLDQELRALGVGAYLAVRTRSTYGYQLHILLEPCAAADHLRDWKAVSHGLQVYFRRWGADPDASGKAVQVFRLPRCHRPDMPGFVTEWVVDQTGPRVPLATLSEALQALGLLEAPKALVAAVTPLGADRILPRELGSGPSLLSLIVGGQVRYGFAKEGGVARNNGIFALWRCLYTEGWDPELVDAAVARVNQLSRPAPLDEAELQKTVLSARNYTWPVSQEVWDGVCRALQVSLAHPGKRSAGAGRLRALRKAPDRYQQMTAWAGEALDRFLSLNPVWQGQMDALLAALGLPASAKRALQQAIRERVEAGAVNRVSRSGRYGYVRLEQAAVVPEESPTVSTVSCIVSNTGGAGGSSVPLPGDTSDGDGKREEELPAGGGPAAYQVGGEGRRLEYVGGQLVSSLRELQALEARPLAGEGGFVQLVLAGGDPAAGPKGAARPRSVERADQLWREVAQALGELSEHGVLVPEAGLTRWRADTSRWTVERHLVSGEAGLELVAILSRAGGGYPPVVVSLGAGVLSRQAITDRIRAAVAWLPESAQVAVTADLDLLVALVLQAGSAGNTA